MSWVGGRNHVLDVCGEYEPTSGWAFSRWLMRSETKHYEPASWAGRASDIRVSATLRVSELSGKAAGFSVEIIVNGEVMLRSESNRCGSCKSAKRLADAWLAESDRVAEALREWYAQERAELIGQSDVETLALFDRDYMILDCGQYSSRGPRSEYTRRINRFPSGYSTESWSGA